MQTLKNLLRRLLEKDPEHRMNLSEAISHPWVTLEGSVQTHGLESRNEMSWDEFDMEVSQSIFFGSAGWDRTPRRPSSCLWLRLLLRLSRSVSLVRPAVIDDGLCMYVPCG